ncbi:MAG: FHA domain-containing protein [Prochlorotrichaceae cyanobacterium]
MITLVLLHPLQGTPVQTWTFQDESVVRIGRAHDNNVVLLSAVVSRHHVEVRQSGNNWDVINLGTNGTYIDAKRVDKIAATDGMVIRLARSGPKIQINLTVHNSDQSLPQPPVQSSSLNEATSANDTSIYPLTE